MKLTIPSPPMNETTATPAESDRMSLGAIDSDTLGEARLTSFHTLSDALTTSVAHIVTTYPHIPIRPQRTATITTLIAASRIFTFMQKSCSPRPFSIASTVWSRYITGTSGARVRMNIPASVLL